MHTWRRIVCSSTAAGILALSGFAAQAAPGGGKGPDSETGRGPDAGGGRNGTVQVRDAGSTQVRSDGHVSCPFEIVFSGFDDNSMIDELRIVDLDKDLDIEDAQVWALSSDAPAPSLDEPYLVEIDPAGLLKESLHVELTLGFTDGNDVKTKTFWLDCADDAGNDTGGTDTNTGGTDTNTGGTDTTTGDDDDVNPADVGGVVEVSSPAPAIPAAPATPAVATPVATKLPVPAAAPVTAAAPAPVAAAPAQRPIEALPLVIGNPDRPQAFGAGVARTGSDTAALGVVGAGLAAIGSLLVLLGTRRPAPARAHRRN